MKQRTHYSCQQCGHTSPKWIGRCPSCQEWNTFVEEAVEPSRSSAAPLSDSTPVRFDALEAGDVPRVSTGVPEFDRVLGGGIVPGALVLLGGDPGVGKSTLMLDVAAALSRRQVVLYASGEESPLQIKLRGTRMGIAPGDLHVYPEMSVERILESAEELGAGAVIVDSIQTTFSEKLEMAPGSIGQVREVASRFLVWTKKQHVPVFLIGHITKDGAIAGPKALEHIVDTVLYFEGPRQHPHRIVRTIKNRFGRANEIGIFEMTSRGLAAVDKPSAMFLSGGRNLEPGSAVVCCVEGTRPLLVEIQALVSQTHLGTARRLATGVDPHRLAMLVAVIEKRLGIRLWDQDIYINVVGGLDIDDPSADLGIVAAILSSFLNRPVPESTVLFGEIGLNGEIRTSLHAEMRIREASGLGFEAAVVPPKTPAGGISEVRTTPVENLHQAVDTLFGPIAGHA